MRSGTVVVDTVAVRPVDRLVAHLLLLSGTPSLKFRSIVNVEKLGGERRGTVDVVWAPVVKGNLYLPLLRCLRSRHKPGVARLCSVMVEISSRPGSYGPGLDRTGRSLCYNHEHHTHNLLFKLFIKHLLTQVHYSSQKEIYAST
jgi:hypothetical protein